MKLSAVIAGAGVRGEVGDDPEVTLVTPDSRAVRPGALFCALPGEKLDGADFAQAAAQAGAVAVIAEREVPCAPAQLLLAGNARRAMALCAASFYEHPSEKLVMVGVTGTNGKTTTTWLVEACAQAAGWPAGVGGTVTYRWPGFSQDATHTTPESTEIQRMLAEMVKAGVRLAALEVSSHALAQERATGIRFKAAGFTNLTRDHLDYHGDMASYFAAKKRLFEELLADDGVAVVNVAEENGAQLDTELRALGKTVWGYGPFAGEIIARHAKVTLGGIVADLETPKGDFQLRSPLVGAHNLENLLCAVGLALAAGIPVEAVQRGLAGCVGAPGRLERIEKGGVNVFVDYAHSDDALARALSALRQLEPRRLICVFGCGGDRDKGKRPLMGKAAAKGADLVVVTSDNPRTEEPQAIIGEIVPGVIEAGLDLLHPDDAVKGARGFVIEADRRKAIALAVGCAQPGDVVLLAGKGHETYQVVGKEKKHFDDREEARRALRVSTASPPPAAGEGRGGGAA